MPFFKRLIFLILCLAFLTKLHAQWDAQFSQYWAVKAYYNPAFAGEIDKIRAVALHRQQWVGIENAPKSFFVSADMPIQFFGMKHGVGITAFSETAGLFTNSSVSGQYAYKQFFGKNILNIGLQGSMHTIGFDASGIKLVAGDSIQVGNGGGGNTQAIAGAEANGQTFDVSAGISWIAKHYFLGISATHLLQPSFDLSETTTSRIYRAYYFMAGCNIRLPNPLYEIQPMAMVKSDIGITQAEATMRLVYNKKFSGGASWRLNDGFVFFIGAKIKGIEAGYAYDLSTSEIGKVSSGSHEIYLRYDLPVDLFKDKKQPHKSVRLL